MICRLANHEVLFCDQSKADVPNGASEMRGAKEKCVCVLRAET